MTSGTVLEIYMASAANEPMASFPSVEALAGVGLAGDRYARGLGFYSNNPITAGAREVTLIDTGAITRVAEETGVAFSAIECRRNLITSGVDLDALIGQAFRIGAAVCEGVRACPPCVHLDELTGKTVMKALVHSGGLRARIVTSGTIRVGDAIDVIGPASGPSVGNDE